MKKLQQFNVMAFTFERLKNNNFNIDISTLEAERNEELIALADNECLRAIRRITNHPFNEDGEQKLSDMLQERKLLTHQKNSVENRKKIAEVNNNIRNILYIPEFISVTTPKKKNYPKIGKDGFFVNGIHYSRFSCSAGNARTNRSMFVADTIFEELVQLLRCGCKDVPIVPAKYNAYFSLTSSATFQVSTPRVCVIPDCEIEREELVDWVNETEDKNEQETITREKRKLGFNLFDGMGLISPDFAKIWSNDLELDYLSSAYCLRNAFVKGMVCVFDFKLFAEKYAKSFIVKDLWGNEKDIRDVDIILTQSQFKLWNAYDSWEDYEQNVIKSGLHWGVSKFAPSKEEEKHICRANYQFLQVLELDDNDIQGLCQPTVDWLKGVSGDNHDYLELYLMGKAAKNCDINTTWNRLQDNFLKALLLEPELFNDNYIQQKIKRSLTKRIRESCIGKLIINSNFEVAISDPYAFCEHLFGLPVKGLLKRDECFCKYWQYRNEKTCAVLRSPLTWRSEVDILSLPNTDEMNYWYQYIDSGVILNVHGLDCNLLGGSDFDFDILFITNNKYFIKGALNDKIPVCYHPKKAKKENIKIKDLYKTDVLGYNTEVGVKTNIGTTFYTLTALYPKGSKEYNELVARGKLCCYQQSMEIDSTKGIAKKPMPDFWTKHTKIEDDDTTDVVEQKEFWNKLRANKRPYFMKYLYSHYKKESTDIEKDFNLYSNIVFGIDFDKNTSKFVNNNKYIEMADYFDKYYSLIHSPSTMNKICYHMEKELANIKHKNKHFDSVEMFKKLKNDNIEIFTDNLKAMCDMKQEYDNFKKTKQLKTSEFSTYEQYYKYLRNKCLQEISSNIQELANLAVYICYYLNPNSPKDFCWDVFGAGIVDNLRLKHSIIRIPKLSEFGDVEYLGEKYDFVEIDLDKESDINETVDLDDIDYDNLFEDINDDIGDADVDI